MADLRITSPASGTTFAPGERFDLSGTQQIQGPDADVVFIAAGFSNESSGPFVTARISGGGGAVQGDAPYPAPYSESGSTWILPNVYISSAIAVWVRVETYEAANWGDGEPTGSPSRVSDPVLLQAAEPIDGPLERLTKTAGLADDDKGSDLEGRSVVSGLAEKDLGAELRPSSGDAGMEARSVGSSLGESTKTAGLEERGAVSSAEGRTATAGASARSVDASLPSRSVVGGAPVAR